MNKVELIARINELEEEYDKRTKEGDFDYDSAEDVSLIVYINSLREELSKIS